MSTIYKTTKLCDFRVENDDGPFYGEVIAINFKGDDPFPFDSCWIYKNKKYYIFAITDNGSMCGHFLPKNLDYKNQYKYSFIIPPCEENDELNEELIKECFYDEYEEHTDGFDEPVGDIYMDFYNFDLSALSKNETYFEEIEL